MNKIIVVGLLVFVIMLTACKDGQDGDLQTMTDSDVADEIPSGEDTGTDSQAQTNESQDGLSDFEVIRHDVQEGGAVVIGLTNELQVDQFTVEPSTDGGINTYVCPLPGIEEKKTYALELGLNLESDAIITLSSSMSDEVYFEWTYEVGLSTLSDTFVFVTTSDMLPQLVITSEGDVSITSVSLVRVVGELKLKDEFDYEGLPDDTIWTYETGGNGWGNGELQYYTGSDLDNVSVGDGYLHITALEERIDNNFYTSTRMRSIDDITYGRVEVMAQIPGGVGTWPAIWMLPVTDRYGAWPKSGEIDIMEHVGYDMDIVHGSIHTGAFNWREGNHPTSQMTIPKVDATFHLYAIEWTKYQIDFYIDNNLYLTFTNDGVDYSHWPYTDGFYLILNIAVGGAWGGANGIDDSAFPAQMLVDYVRIYTLEDEVVDTVKPSEVIITSAVVEGAIVSLEWEQSSDNYLVDYYNVYKDSELYKTTTDTSLLIYDLEAGENYTFSVEAIDIAGNVSDRTPFSIDTQAIDYMLIPGDIEVDQVYYNEAGDIEFTDDNISYLNWLDDGEMLIYAVDIPSSGDYILEVSYQSKILKGMITLSDQYGLSYTTLELPSTGSSGDWAVLGTEAFYLEKGKKVLILGIDKGGFKLDKISLIEAN
ncbi:MAG: family 16 glycosylhydrolase [Vallitaleaceae bacterium]|jgi:beta-glucanase (GH16 family)|nr:family 16 glycosylhydrolase [Vallitaleaceae bacterium]